MVHHFLWHWERISGGLLLGTESSTPNCRWFFQQLIVGVDYLHRMEIASRDIKLENTLLDNSPRPLVKICDFGYSKVCPPAFTGTLTGVVCGSQTYYVTLGAKLMH